MRKVIALCATRNFYEYTAVLVQSIFYNNSHIDKIYIFAEDDEISQLKKFNDTIEVKNINKINIDLKTNNPNYNTYFTYMSMLRLWFPEILPEEDIVLYLDIDMIVIDNIEELWDIDLSNYYCAMVPEQDAGNFTLQQSKFIYNNNIQYRYCNSGIVLFNLAKMRKDNITQKLISFLFTHKLTYPDQDALNYICYKDIYYLSAIYNTMIYWNHNLQNTKIIHYSTIYVKPWKQKNELTAPWWKYKDILEGE